MQLLQGEQLGVSFASLGRWWWMGVHVCLLLNFLEVSSRASGLPYPSVCCLKTMHAPKCGTSTGLLCLHRGPHIHDAAVRACVNEW